MAEGGSPSTHRVSPPKAVIDTSPLLLEQNKESLKVKLMLRRPFDQLVAQGIMPPHKTPAAYHGQRRQLERAKTGDMLKAKIQQRPPRQELERRHILEDNPGHVDPSLAERQRMLKKARLADQLNDQLSHRPGPLELIQKNILHTEEPIEHAVKAGRIPYRATCEGQLNRPTHPSVYINPEDDSQSSEGDLVSPGPSSQQGDVLETAAKSAGIVVSLIPASEAGAVVLATQSKESQNNGDVVFADLCRSVAAPLIQGGASPASLVSSTSTLSPLSSVCSPVPSIVSQPPTPAPAPPPLPRLTPSPAKSDAPGKDKINRKKNKNKSAPKTRTIKFHEYKGPPSAQQKNTSSNSPSSGESSYELLLHQQTLLLQFQLQLQHKYPQIILPANQKATVPAVGTSGTTEPQPNPSVTQPTEIQQNTQIPTKLILGRLEDMKVSDLKAELKRRSLPVSGSKPQLIERLKPFTGSTSSETSSVIEGHEESSQNDIGSPQTMVSDDLCEQMDIGDPLSPSPSLLQEQHVLQTQPNPLSPQALNILTANQNVLIAKSQQNHTSQKTQEDIVREQQRQIEELQRELTLSQMKLQAATRGEPKAQVIALQKHLQAKQQQAQMSAQLQQLQALQARQAQTNQEEQNLRQQQHVAFQNQKNLMQGGLILNSADAAIVLNLIQGKAKLLNGRANSLPNFVNLSTLQPAKTVEDVKPPPPLYEEATKNKNISEIIENISGDPAVKIKKEGKNNVKSQIVDDVLEILIKNGELPPSAANDPSTPGSAGTRQVAEPIFPSNNNQNEENYELDSSDLLETLDSLENMDFSQFVMEINTPNQNQSNEPIIEPSHSPVPMDTDDWLESLLPSDNSMNLNNQCGDSDLRGFDPLLGIAQDPYDPFCLEDIRSGSDLTNSLWDKVDFAA